MNAEYMKKLSPEAFYAKAEPIPEVRHLPPCRSTSRPSQPWCSRAAEILSDLPERVDFLDTLPDYDPALYVHKKSKTTLENSLTSLQAILPVLEGLTVWTNESLYEALVALAAKLEVKIRSSSGRSRAVSGKRRRPAARPRSARCSASRESIDRVIRGIELLGK